MGCRNASIKLKFFLKLLSVVFLFFYLSPIVSFAENYEATGVGDVVDSKMFGGLTKEEFEKLKKM